MDILLFGVKYYIQPPKNQEIFSTVDCITDISNLGSWGWSIFLIIALEGKNLTKFPNIMSQISAILEKLSIKSHESLLKLHIYPEKSCYLTSIGYFDVILDDLLLTNWV